MFSSHVSELQEKAKASEKDVWSAKSHAEALEAAITTAESYMLALKISTDATEKSKIDAKCKEWIDIAEKIKVEPEWKGVSLVSPGSDPFLAKPLSTRELTTKEKIIILEGSKINGFVFPPWNGDPGPEEFILSDGQELWKDTIQLDISQEQQDIFDDWKRPFEAFSNLSRDKLGDEVRPTMEASTPLDLVQDATSDCSIVASLCVGTARAKRGYAKRKVVIDDLLPMSKNSRTLYVIDRNNPGLLWPALIEKAYLKVRGGYDFPGSNSGTDIATLIGWIPEQVFLHDDDILPKELWRRLYSAFGHGDILLTLGTGKLSEREQRHSGLAGEHDYAVIDIREVGDTCEMLIKNPWSDGDVWKGKKGKANSQMTDHDLEGVREPLTPGTFWMDLGSVFQHFENMYINWNPGLFKYREDVHFTWDLTQSSDLPGYFGSNPQFEVITTNGPAWLLLSKHFKSGEYSAKSFGSPGYISLYLFGNGGRKVFVSDGAIKRGPFVDAPNTLLKVDLAKNTAYTVVIASQSLQSEKHNFTLSAFSRSKTRLRPATALYDHTLEKVSSWTSLNAGGNSDSPFYTTNPQFSFSLPIKASVAILISTSSPDIAVHARLFFISTSPSAPSRRIATARPRDVLAQTGDYRRSCAITETTLDAGLYTIICSTFEANQHAQFKLSVSSTCQPTHLRLLPSESSGRLSTIAPPAIFPADADRMLAPIEIPRLTNARFIARYKAATGASSPFPTTSNSKAPQRGPPLKISLELGQGPYKQVIASSSDPFGAGTGFSDDVLGVRIGDLDLRPEWCADGNGGLWVVIEKMTGPSGQGGGTAGGGGGGGGAMASGGGYVEVEILGMEGRVEIGAWGVGAG
ncbi:putative calpain-like protease ory [Phaeomoniella chlamydospora]|uniref:Putative calpain-like protease ory n=1 Tax=Phaeomoniella chlamydospora TaxID=158046 RepID=A0A0G2GDL5_PHACM|nr:putative calpain-like protease ory [Phaeomoniella chlamydospora]